MNWYNGFSPEERWAKLEALRALQRAAVLPWPRGECSICGDKKGRLVEHSEDYGKPYLFKPPAMYLLCKSGHAMVHLRFRNPERWEEFKAHIRRGGRCSQFGMDWTGPGRPARSGRRAQAEMFGLGEMVRPGARELTGEEWWEKLTLDPASLTDPKARPRGGAPPASTGSPEFSKRYGGR